MAQPFAASAFAGRNPQQHIEDLAPDLRHRRFAMLSVMRR
jgi:hypothetical protein